MVQATTPVRVVVSGKPTYQGEPWEQFLSSNQVRVLIEGKEIVCEISDAEIG